MHPSPTQFVLTLTAADCTRLDPFFVPAVWVCEESDTLLLLQVKQTRCCTRTGLDGSLAGGPCAPTDACGCCISSLPLALGLLRMPYLGPLVVQLWPQLFV
jgi:hypothetical protein